MFEWKKELDLGIPSIDVQHKELFRIANRIYDLMIIQSEDYLADYDEITSVMNELKEYTKYHFQSEEELFLKYKYPDANEHIEEHNAFNDYLEMIIVDDIVHQKKQFLKELFDKLANWVFHHMITTDYLFKEYLVKLGTNELVV